MSGQDTNKIEYYKLSVIDAVNGLKSNPKGLSKEESALRLAQIGPNKLQKIKRDNIIIKFLRQFKDLMIILLIVSAFIALYLGDKRTFLILILIVIINSLIGFFQEYKAEKIMESLKALVVDEAKIYRDGVLTKIEAVNLVPGDIFYIEEGDFVPADGRIIEEAELSSNDFALTGESNPCRKFTHPIRETTTIGNQRNLVFMGTSIATGNAKCVVVATGMDTELGRIASLSQETKHGPSPLQVEMGNVAKKITFYTILLAIVLVAVSLRANLGINASLIFAIGIASAMIPQGLPAEINVSLAQAANLLAKAKALVKKLSAVETLGSTNVICTDKTGTLTKNEMTVEKITLLDKHYTVSGIGYEINGQVLNDNGTAISPEELKDLHKFLVTGYFSSNAKINEADERHHSPYCIGDPTEGALVVLAQKAGIDTSVLDKNYPELKEFPFDSVRKRMSSFRSYNGKLTLFVKGSPESVLAKCEKIFVNGKVRPITKSDIKLIESQNDMYANNAMRNLAYAYREFPDNKNIQVHNPDLFEKELIYYGMVSLIDPVREEVAAAMQAAREAHIKVSIITGDYAPTAKAIAMRAKLTNNPEDLQLITSDELPKMTDKQVLDVVLKGGVIFARVSPEDKLRIVKLVKNSGSVIAVTGDGINDAPALKQASIGVAMGRTGTDVAIQSAEIVLLDDSFGTLIKAVQQGRTVFQNIKKATLACLTSNFGELFVVLIGLLGASIFNIPPAILVVQILAIDLIAELFPLAALGWDSADKTLMSEQPRDLNDHIIHKKSMLDILFTGLLMGGLSYISFLYFAYRHDVAFQDISKNATLYAAATGLTYVTIVLCQLINILIRRFNNPTLRRNLFTNNHLWIAMGFSIFCILNIIYNPWIQPFFNTSGLSLIDWACAFGFALIFFVLREIYKLIELRQYRKKQLI